MLIGALDIGGTKTIVAIANEQGQILAKITFATHTADFKEHGRLCIQLLEKLAGECSAELADLAGIGVSMPGMVDFARGFLLHAPFAGWRDVAVVEYFQTILPQGIPVFIDNDTNNCALAEVLFGGSGERDYIWMTVSTGIGSTLISDGNLIAGASFCAGEIGHFRVEEQNPRPCTCGRAGCLEAHASGTAIGRIFREALADSSSLRNQLEANGLSDDAPGCAQLAKLGNPTGMEIYRQAGDYMGKALSWAVNLLNPAVVFMGGGVSRDLELLRPAILHRIEAEVVRPSNRVGIRQSQLGYEASLLGAAALVLKKL
ncbi:ROK family protein [Oscillospiraceae bacterium MB08-C2-2]|nr:ROK family protein [Oscillospiraceae bacterium MB08-C2-2]